MKKLTIALALLLVAADFSGFAQNSAKDEAGRVLGLETAWNRAIEEKNTNALDMILGIRF